MEDLQAIREALLHVAVIFAFVTAVLVMALADVGMTLILMRWSSKIRKSSELPQPSLPELPSDHQVVVLGGGVKRWD
jgi:hypothetical protein